MKRPISWTMMFCLATAQMAFAAETAPAPVSRQHKQYGEDHMKQDEADVQTAIERMTSSFEKNDLDAVMQSYEPGAAVLFEPAQPVTDEAQLRQMFAAMASAEPVFKYSGHEVVVSGDTALHIAPWQMTARTPDGQEVRQSGLSVAVLRRQADGSWKMVIDNPHGARLLPQMK